MPTALPADVLAGRARWAVAEDDDGVPRKCPSCRGAGSVAAGPCGANCCTATCGLCRGEGRLWTMADGRVCDVTGRDVTASLEAP